MDPLDAGTAYEILNETGYRIEVGSIPHDNKGGAPAELHIATVTDGIVQAEERWPDIGKVRSRRLYRETVEALLRHGDIERLSHSETASDTAARDESAAGETPAPGAAEATAESSDPDAGQETTTQAPDAAEQDDISGEPPTAADTEQEPTAADTTGTTTGGLIPDDLPEVTDEDEPVVTPPAEGNEQSTDDGTGADYQREYATQADAEFIDDGNESSQQPAQSQARETMLQADAAGDETEAPTDDGSADDEDDEFLVGS